MPNPGEVVLDLTIASPVGTATVAVHTCTAETETVWRLVIQGEALPDGYLLRTDEFVELGDAAEWRHPAASG